MSAKLENQEEDFEETSFVDVIAEEEFLDQNELETSQPLPCEHPSISSGGIQVFGGVVDSSWKPRSYSTSINRVEFPCFSPTLSPIREHRQQSSMVWDEGTYNAKKLNCFKKKKKVEGLILLYDKEAVTSIQDEKIYENKLTEISNATLEAMEYMDEVVLELEANQEENRMAEIEAILCQS